VVINLREASPFVLATLGFGYGMSVTTMQLAKAYLIFANHGDILPISLLHNDEPVAKKQIIDATVADQVLEMMEAVVGEEGGTGKDAQVPGYRVAGKTGTARIAGVGGYKEKRYISSFVGIAPVSNPKIIVAVVINEPTRLGYYAAAVAAPLFSKIMSTTLRILDIPPDKTIKTT
jgi:cell division protein FtsI (penicillin-binding protein 3)